MSPTQAPTAADILDDVHQLEDHAVKAIAKVQAGRDEEIHGLKATIAKVADELHGEKQRADTAEAAGVEMADTIADGIRREERLHAELRAERRISAGLEGLLDDDRGENHRLREHVARLAGEKSALETQLGELRLLRAIDNADKQRRFPGDDATADADSTDELPMATDHSWRQHMTDITEHLCPRRVESPRQFPGPDTWDNRGGLGGQESAGTSCSYCGSLDPDRFMELVREGWQVGPTDKSHKAYLGRPLTDDEQAARKARWSDGVVGQAVRETAIGSGKTPDEAQSAVDKYWLAHEEPLVGTAKTVAKFYYQHLSPEQQDEFIRLHNAKRMNVGDPGYFYAKPYFCGTGETTP